MPITLSLSQDVLGPDSIPQAVQQITAAFLSAHGLADNPVMTANVTAHVHVLPAGSSFAGGQPVAGAWVETRTPSFALTDRGAQQGFFATATDILVRLSNGRLSPDRVWSNGVHAVDGSWNLNGTAMTNAEIAAAIATI